MEHYGEAFIFDDFHDANEGVEAPEVKEEPKDDAISNVTLVQKPSSERQTTQTVIEVPETEATIKLLVHFMHKQRYPDLGDVPFVQLLDLAYAAEKYVVHSAMAVCNAYILMNTPSYPLESLVYATKFCYPRIADAAAPYTIAHPMSSIRTAFGEDIAAFAAWYRESFLDVLRSIILVPPPKNGSTQCQYWDGYASATIADVPRDPTLYLQQIVTGQGFPVGFYQKHKSELKCDVFNCDCFRRMNDWEKNAREASIPAYSTFLQRE
ncbi:hypothetical protein MD484_g4311, partial [Candolleomyces efflorescens]